MCLKHAQLTAQLQLEKFNYSYDGSVEDDITFHQSQRIYANYCSQHTDIQAHKSET